MQLSTAPSTVRDRIQGNQLWQKHKALVISYGLILVILFVGWLRHPSFISAGNIRQQLVLASFLGIIAAGQTILILTGGIDLSVAWNLNFAAIMLTKLAGNQNTFGAVTWAIVAAVGAATFFGVINGLGVAYLRIPPLVMSHSPRGYIGCSSFVALASLLEQL